MARQEDQEPALEEFVQADDPDLHAAIEASLARSGAAYDYLATH